jgi:hypothetical protein
MSDDISASKSRMGEVEECEEVWYFGQWRR